jgi:hypothetical protein
VIQTFVPASAEPFAPDGAFGEVSYPRASSHRRPALNRLGLVPAVPATFAQMT